MMKALLLFIVAVLALWLAPLLGIWSVNTLFGAGVAYNTATWFAALVIMSILNPPSMKAK